MKKFIFYFIILCLIVANWKIVVPIILITVAVLFYFNKNNKGKSNDDNDVFSVTTTSSLYSSNKYFDEYINLIQNRPDYAKYFGRKYDLLPYADTVQTAEGYKLRELLLLVWWGNVKNGRKKETAIPKYFFSSYNLNASKLTNEFFKNEMLFENDGKIFLTDKGKEIAKKYHDLWEIHSFKGAIMNLDFDFPGWNLDEFTKKYYLNQIKYLNAENDYYKRLNTFLNKGEYPEDAAERERMIESNFEQINSNILRINDFRAKLEVLNDSSGGLNV